jgi:hypothetical protein
MDTNVADFETHLVDADGDKPDQRIAAHRPKIPTGDRKLGHDKSPNENRRHD